MNVKSLAVITLVDRGLALRTQIESLKKELESVEADLLKQASEGEQVPLVDEEREGKQFLATGTEKIVPVIFTADKIIGSFKNSSATHVKIALAAGRHLSSFYKSQTTWENQTKSGKAFRTLAGELLGKDGPALVTACLARDKYGVPKSDIKIEWDAAKNVPKEVQP